MSNNTDSRWSYNRFIDTIRGAFPLRYSPRDKGRNILDIVGYMLARTQSMFVWEGLPETIPPRMMELYLQTNGNVCMAEHEGKLYAFTGGLGGPPDPYYMPTIYTVANPALKLSRMYHIGEDCVVIPSDSVYMGLLPLFSRYASTIVEGELSLYIALVNTRLVDLITAGTDRTKAAADKVISDVEDGRLSVVIDKSLDGSIKTYPYSQVSSRTLTELIETIQYAKASWYNEVGLNANYNMKRESITSGETQLNNDALLPLVDDMLRQRQRGADQVNEMFGTAIKVSLASAWEDNLEEIALEHQALRDEPEEDTEEGENWEDALDDPPVSEDGEEDDDEEDE